MKNSIGKPYKGKLHSLPELFGTCPELFGIRFDEGGTDSIQIIIIFTEIKWSVLSGSTLLGKIK